MRKERQAILHLVAAGRLSGAEAERLLIASNESRELAWLAAVAMLVCIAQTGGAFWEPFARLAHEIPGIFPAMQAAVSALSSNLVTLVGGTL
jgi:type II secretory pathway component PulM